MDSIIEQQRQMHEDIERLEQSIIELMMQDLTKHRYKLLREHKINNILEQIQSRSKLLMDMNEDISGLRKKEITGIVDNKFNEFYSRLGDIKDFHRRNPTVIVSPPELEYMKYKNNPEEVDMKEKELRSKGEDGAIPLETASIETFVAPGDQDKLDAMFSGEEQFGRYIDLNTQHEEFLNLKEAPKLTYTEYLNEFHNFGLYPRKLKSEGYQKYLSNLRVYFDDFFARSMPLFDISKVQKEAELKLQKDWDSNSVSGWETVKEDARESMQLYCTACKKQFEKDTTFNAHLNSRKHKKTVKRIEEESSDNTGKLGSKLEMQQRTEEAERRIEKKKEIALSECIICSYVRVLTEKIRDTQANVERKQALTEEERNQEIAEDEPEVVEYDEDKDDHIYNPLNLPLGWDGKPIPYWLYKLHGLSVKYYCEICGNSVYRGRKAFEKHFQETRHATNMHRLGVPNTRQFHGVVKIEDVLALWERVKKEKNTQVTNADNLEEFEDSEGNVFNKKTYLDLKRQGLI